MISFHVLALVRVSDPLVPRAMFGVLNRVDFPSVPSIRSEISALASLDSYIDPFTYAVHALKAYC